MLVLRASASLSLSFVGQGVVSRCVEALPLQDGCSMQLVHGVVMPDCIDLRLKNLVVVAKVLLFLVHRCEDLDADHIFECTPNSTSSWNPINQAKEEEVGEYLCLLSYCFHSQNAVGLMYFRGVSAYNVVHSFWLIGMVFFDRDLEPFWRKGKL